MSAVLPGYHTELLDGAEIERPLPKKLHALIQRFLLPVLARELLRLLIALPELKAKCGSDRLVADVGVIERPHLFKVTGAAT